MNKNSEIYRSIYIYIYIYIYKVYIQKSVVSVFGASVIHTTRAFAYAISKSEKPAIPYHVNALPKLANIVFFLLNISAALILKSDIQI